jgi:formylglycine-generating enzyme
VRNSQHIFGFFFAIAGMKYFPTMVRLALVLLLLPVAMHAQLFLPRKAQALGHFLDGFVGVPEGYHGIGHGHWVRTIPSDSVLIYTRPEEVVDLPSYWMASNEVTNAEYREFTLWVRDSVVRDFLYRSGIREYGIPCDELSQSWACFKGYRINWQTELDIYRDDIYELVVPHFYQDVFFYRNVFFDADCLEYRYQSENGMERVERIAPDSTCWTREEWFGISLEQSYFNHSAYAERPVVGVTLSQAMAYAHWRTQWANSTLKEMKRSKIKSIRFRVPTESEWEAAAVWMPGRHQHRMKGRSRDYPGESPEYYLLQANLGDITDEQGFLVRESEDDGEYLPADVGSYPPSALGLYDMMGNVAEWTVSELMQDHFDLREDHLDYPAVVAGLALPDSALTSTEDAWQWIGTHFPKAVEDAKSRTWKYDLIQASVALAVRDAGLVRALRANSIERLYIAKGGHYQSTFVQAEPFVRWPVPASTQTSRIGFRLVCDIQKVEAK